MLNSLEMSKISVTFKTSIDNDILVLTPSFVGGKDPLKIN